MTSGSMDDVYTAMDVVKNLPRAEKRALEREGEIVAPAISIVVTETLEMSSTQIWTRTAPSIPPEIENPTVETPSNKRSRVEGNVGSKMRLLPHASMEPKPLSSALKK